MFELKTDLSRELHCAVEAARAAGELVLQLRDGFSKRLKPDGSVVTNADIASAELIRRRINRDFPDDAVLTEEDDDDNLTRLECNRCWIVDPIDGTNAYVSGSPDFDVYIALADEGTPVVSVTYQPVTGQTVAAAASSGAWLGVSAEWRRAILPAVQSPPVLVTRHWLGAPANLEWIHGVAARVGAQAIRSKSGISARSFLVAGVDAIIGRSTTDKPISAKEWDIAPLDLFVREAGGWSSDLRGQPLKFNKRNPNVPFGIVLARTHELGEQIIAAIEDLEASSRF